MTKNQKTTLTEGLRRIIADLAVIADLFEDSEESTRSRASPAEAPLNPMNNPEAPDVPAQSIKEATLEEARAALAEKSRTGYRAEVKALLTACGVRQLSEITDPAVFARLIDQAAEIGKADADG